MKKPKLVAPKTTAAALSALQAAVAPRRKTAADLIAGKHKAGITPPDEALEQIRLIVAHNDDQAASPQRVGRDQTITLLRDYGIVVGHLGLDRICQQFLGRKSFATP